MDIINDIHFKILEKFDESYNFVENIAFSNFLNINLNELPHLVMYGPNGSFKDYYLYYLIYKKTGKYRSNLSRVNEKIVVNSNTIDFDIMISTNYTEINLARNNFYDRWIITDYIQNIIKMKPINQDRHIIVLKDLDKASHNCFMALRRIMEIYTNNALFICTATNLSHITEAIRSRCFCIRCPLQPEKSFKLFLNHYIKDKNILKNVILKSNRNINTAVMLQYKPNFVNEIVNVLDDEIKNHHQIMKKTKDIFIIAKLNRDFLHKILNFDYDNKDIIKLFRDYMIKLYIKKEDNQTISKIISISAKTDHELATCGKDFFVFEKYLLLLYKIIHYPEK
jgi:DNA polymerase III delta prime subunit